MSVFMEIVKIDLARLRDEAGSLGIDEVVSEMNNQLERNRK